MLTTGILQGDRIKNVEKCSTLRLRTKKGSSMIAVSRFCNTNVDTQWKIFQICPKSTATFLLVIKENLTIFDW